MSRTVEDRVAESLRRERLGNARPLWADFSEGNKDEWLSRARNFIRICKSLHVNVKDEDA